ncbi:hypothetical protein [Mycobacterium kansasii]|nr:hypothetical protein [Mycobacterium kansasii]
MPNLPWGNARDSLNFTQPSFGTATCAHLRLCTTTLVSRTQKPSDWPRLRHVGFSVALEARLGGPVEVAQRLLLHR